MAAGLHGSATPVDTGNFEAEVLRADRPVLVDFWAEWCGPCRALAPLVDEVTRGLAGRIKLATVNVDQSPDLARRYEVSSIPCLVLFQGGVEARRIVGLVPRRRLLDALTGLAVS